jgi:thiamine biosynthesis protein ThiS
MQIFCNGRQQNINKGTTLGKLLTDLDLPADTVVAEINKKIIDRDQYETLTLSEGDQVELIRFVGGG